MENLVQIFSRICTILLK